MKLSISHSLIAASLAFAMTSLAVTPVQVHAASTREQVKMDRDTFLATMRWDDSMSAWVLKDGMAMPQGVASRAEILEMRDKFLSMNTWDESSSQWVPVKGGPRDMSKLTREQVRMETEVFLKMYRYDESSSSWVSRNR